MSQKYNRSVADIIRHHYVEMGDGQHAFIPVMTREVFLATKGKHYFAPKRQFMWPVLGIVSSKFGKRWGRMHEGIDISAPEGTPIRSSQSGIVIYSGNEVSGYGNLIVISHKSGYVSVYGHNKSNLVKKGDAVREGQIIARVGKSGKSTGHHLHFELRKNNIAMNPLNQLKKTYLVTQAAKN
ncbi:MAG: M23 family metallopeptidase [Deltaproteobacteria bacterium]|nr:M23 family metallopeptidase [Deltaproteobacteria bacterium]